MSVCRYLLVSTLLLATSAVLHATQDVTAINTTTIPGSPSTVEGYTFNNGVRQVTSFSTATSTYIVSSGADNVFIRRNGVNANNSSVWYTNSGVGTDLAGVHYNDYGQLLRNNNLFGGSDNTFANGITNTTGNIERLDFTWNSPITVNNSFAFAVFDRGAVGVHDSFAIAAVTAVDAFGNPTAYGTLLRVNPGWGGAANPIGDFDYRFFRYANGNNLTATTDSATVNTQGIGGIVITAADLGLALGQNIYGYSLMAVDVTASNSAELLDWTNATFYPTTTDGNTGGGGIDLAAINGIAFAAVPEPVPTSALVAFMVVAAFSWHKRKTGNRS
jgi:hypothetical protein